MSGIVDQSAQQPSPLSSCSFILTCRIKPLAIEGVRMQHNSWPRSRRFLRVAASPNQSFQPTPLRGAAEFQRYASIMEAQLCNPNGIIGDLVDHPVFVIYPLRPIARQRVLKWLRFAYSFKRRSGYILDNRIDPNENLLIRFLPVKVVFPCLL